MKKLRRWFKLANMKRKSFFLFLSASLLAGCGTDKEPLRFSDEHLQRPADPITRATLVELVVKALPEFPPDE